MTDAKRETGWQIEVEVGSQDAVATVSLHHGSGVVKIDASFAAAFDEALDRALSHHGLAGIIITSTHDAFCVGADIEMLRAAQRPEEVFALVNGLHRLFRRLETCGVPVVAALNGTTLGGGYELALACHHRIMLDNPSARIGLPEVGLGLIPGSGGTQRLPRLVGLKKALELIVQGRLLRPGKALAAGLVAELAPDQHALMGAARAFIAANPSAAQPWERKEFRFPPPSPKGPEARDLVLGSCAMVYRKTAGALRAPEVAIQAIYEGALLASMDRALEVEARHFTKLATSPQAKDMMRTLWGFRNAAEKQKDLPSAERDGIEKVTVLGAGMMGAALAFVCAQRGYQVVVKDIEQPALDSAEAHIETLVKKRLRHLDAEGQAAVRARVTTTLVLEPITGSDLVIEAVVEDMAIKHAVVKEIEPLLAPGAIWASNTSALPISELAEASAHPERFVGLHFFSPVEQMPLVEVIAGKASDHETIGRALAFCGRLSKTPILVNDGYGFFTTRAFSAYILEGAQLVTEGYDPEVIEWAARNAGMAVGPLQVFDEVTLTLVRHAFENGREYLAEHRMMAKLPGFDLVCRMVDEEGRNGRTAGKGFYHYDQEGKRVGIWPGLLEFAGGSAAPMMDQAAQQEHIALRLLMVQALEAVRTLEAGVLRRPQDAEVGAILGLGFAPNTGGPFSYLERMGLTKAVEQLSELAQAGAERFEPPALLVRLAEQGESFFD